MARPTAATRIVTDDWHPAVDLADKVSLIIDPNDVAKVNRIRASQDTPLAALTGGESITTNGWPDSSLRGGLGLTSGAGTVTWEASEAAFNDNAVIRIGTLNSYMSSSSGITLIWAMGVFNWSGGAFNYPNLFMDATQTNKIFHAATGTALYVTTGEQQSLPNTMLNATDSTGGLAFTDPTTPKSVYRRKSTAMTGGIRIGASTGGWTGDIGYLIGGRTDLALSDFNLLLAYLNERFELY